MERRYGKYNNQQMKEVIAIVNQVRDTSSTKEKLSILTNEKDNELLKQIIRRTYDPDLKYGITENIISKYIRNNKSLFYVFDLLDILAENNINDELRTLTGDMLGSLPEDERGLIMRVLTKDLRCGISLKTIRKIWSDLIPKWEVQQAYSFDDYKLNDNEWIALSEKMNGCRGSFLNGQIKSRQNKVFTGLQHIISDLYTLGLDDYFVDGELIRDNYDGIADNTNFRKSTSILTAEGVDKSEIKFVIYDIVPKVDFLNGESKSKYPQRIKNLDTISKFINEKGLTNVEVLPILYQGTDHNKIQEWLKWADNNDKEGIMLYRDSTYKCKRHSGILKVKSFKHCDVECIGVAKGKGKLANTLGSIIVDYKGYPCGVTGFTDEERTLYYNNPELIIGRIVQVKYKEESTNKNGTLSMQFATFECVREEGKEISYN